MQTSTVLTFLAAIILVQAAPFASSIPFGGSKSITSSFPSDNQVLEKRTPSVGNTNLASRGYDIQSLSNNKYNLRKRCDPSPSSITTASRNVKRGGYNPWDPQSGYEGYESNGDIKKRREPCGTRGSTSKLNKRNGGYDPKSPQDGNGGKNDGGYGDDLKKRSSRSSSNSLRKRGDELDPVDPFEAAMAHGDADLRKREKEAVMGLES